MNFYEWLLITETCYGKTNKKFKTELAYIKLSKSVLILFLFRYKIDGLRKKIFFEEMNKNRSLTLHETIYEPWFQT